MSDYFKDAWDLNNLGINREKSVFLTPKASQSGGSGENNVASPKKQTTKTDRDKLVTVCFNKLIILLKQLLRHLFQQLLFLKDQTQIRCTHYF